MTPTTIVPTVTDELIAELEAAADTSIEGCSVWYEEDGFLITLADTCDQPFMAKASPATVKALLAHIVSLKQQLAAASVDAERWRDIVQSVVDEIPHRSAVRGNAPGHGHDVPGIWDSDNGPLAGKECAWCKTWHSAIDAARNVARSD